MTFYGLFLNFDPLKPPREPPGWGWVKCFWARMIHGSIRTCVPNLVAVRRSCRKRGGGTDTHMHASTYARTHAHKGTLQLYIIDIHGMYIYIYIYTYIYIYISKLFIMIHLLCATYFFYTGLIVHLYFRPQ